MSVENKHADGGRDGQTCLARPNSQANGDSGCVWRISTLTGDGTAKPVLRVQILRREQGIRLSVENKDADGGRDGRTCLARQTSQALTGIHDECGE